MILFKKIMYAVAIAWTTWLLASWCDIGIKNLDGLELAAWNFVKLFI